MQAARTWIDRVSRYAPSVTKSGRTHLAHECSDRCDPAMLAVLRAQTPAARLATLDAMWRAGVALVRSGVAARHPDWTESRIAGETARLMSGGHRADGRA